MESLKDVIEAVFDAHAGDINLLALQLRASPASVQRWVSGASKPRAVYEAKLRRLYSELRPAASVREGSGEYRVTPHHPMIVEAVDATLRGIREILHKRAHLSSRTQALDELAKLLFAHVCGLRGGDSGLSRSMVSPNGRGLAVSLKRYVDKVLRENLPESLSHRVDATDFQLKLRPHEDDLAAELLDCFERLQRQTSSFNFSGFDILNEVFGKFLADSFIDEKELGQYLTPVEVVRFMCGLAVSRLSKEERRFLSSPEECSRFGLILDPSCGVGSFLAEMTSRLRDTLQVRETHKDRWLDSLLSNVIVGVDKSERMVRLALTNLAMFGFPKARLYLANSLSRNSVDGQLAESFVGKARLILTNPPFGASFDGNDLVKYRIMKEWPRRVPTRIDSEVLFFERYLDWLAPGGQLLAVVPDSILTNKGIFEDLRRGVAEEIELLAVVSLPPVTFSAAGTSTKTSVVHLRKKADRATRSRAAFAICEDIGFTVSTKSNHRVKVVQGDGDLPKILAEIESRSPAERIRWINEPTSRDRWDAQHHASLTTEVELRLAGDRDGDVYVSDVAELVDQRVDPRRWGAKRFNYIEISDIDTQSSVVYSNSIDASATPSRARKLVKQGDVLVSTVRPERGAVGVVGSHQDGSICTTGLAVLRPTGIHPVLLAHLLKTPFVITQLMRNNIGIAYPAISEACLLEVLLPITRDDVDAFKHDAAVIVDIEHRLYELRQGFAERLHIATQQWRQMSLTTQDSKPRPVKRTTSRLQLHKKDSGSHAQDVFELEEVRTA
jgi:type I restriction-modification system DNA methylase subunit